MHNTVSYRPYQSDVYFAGATFIIGILSFVALGHCLTVWGPACYFFAIVGVVAIGLAKTLYDSSQLSILFEFEGIRVTGGKHSNYQFIPWNKCIYAYYVRNYKGHLFLILSPQALSLKQAKNCANRSANANKICIDSVCVIHLNYSQTASQIENLINLTIPHIDMYQE